MVATYIPATIIPKDISQHQHLIFHSIQCPSVQCQHYPDFILHRHLISTQMWSTGPASASFSWVTATRCGPGERRGYLFHFHSAWEDVAMFHFVPQIVGMNIRCVNKRFAGHDEVCAEEGRQDGGKLPGENTTVKALTSPDWGMLKLRHWPVSIKTTITDPPCWNGESNCWKCWLQVDFWTFQNDPFTLSAMRWRHWVPVLTWWR